MAQQQEQLIQNSNPTIPSGQSVATEEERDKKAKTGLTKPKIESKKKLTKGKKNETKAAAAGPLSKVYQNSMMS